MEWIWLVTHFHAQACIGQKSTATHPMSWSRHELGSFQPPLSSLNAPYIDLHDKPHNADLYVTSLFWRFAWTPWVLDWHMADTNGWNKGTSDFQGCGISGRVVMENKWSHFIIKTQGGWVEPIIYLPNQEMSTLKQCKRDFPTFIVDAAPNKSVYCSWLPIIF